METSMVHLLELQKYVQPLHIDTNISYDLDTALFPGLDDPQQMYQPALLIATDWSGLFCTHASSDSCNDHWAEDTNSIYTTQASDLHFEDLPDLLPRLDEETFQDLVDDVTTDTDSPADYFEDINIKQSCPETSTLSSSWGEDRGIHMSFPSDSLCDEELSPFSDLLSPFSDDIPPLGEDEPVFEVDLLYFDDDMSPFEDSEQKDISLNDFTSALNLQISSMVSSNTFCLPDVHPIH